MRYIIQIIASCFLFNSCCIFTPAYNKAQPNIDLKIALKDSILGQSEQVYLFITLVNKAPQPVKLLTWKNDEVVNWDSHCYHNWSLDIIDKDGYYLRGVDYKLAGLDCKDYMLVNAGDSTRFIAELFKYSNATNDTAQVKFKPLEGEYNVKMQYRVYGCPCQKYKVFSSNTVRLIYK